MGFVRKIRGSVPGQAVPIVQDREMIQDANTGDVYIGYNGTNKLVSGNGTISDQVTTLENDKLDKSDVTTTADPNKVARRDSNGKLEGDITGVAARATKLANTITISMTGGASATGTFDGSANLSLSVTVDPDAHEHSLTDLADFPDLTLAEGKILRVVDGALVPDSETVPDNVYTKAEVDAIAEGLSASSHNHNDIYLTDQEVVTALSGKASSTHTHDDRYYTESEIDARLDGKSSTGHTHDEYIEAFNTATDEATAALSNYVVASNSAKTAAELAAVNSAQSASTSTTQASIATAQAGQALAQADRAATFVGGNWPLPHSHSSAPLAVDPVFTRLSDAYDASLKRYEYGQRRWGANGTLIEEGTTNLLPAGAENFVTGWVSQSGETISVTNYPVNIPGIGDVIAKRITGNGAGGTLLKYLLSISGLTNPHTTTMQMWVLLLGNNASIGHGASLTPITSTMTKWTATRTITTTTDNIYLQVINSTDILDVVVYAPQIEAKPYATSYTPPGTTRAAESLAIPVGATQKNLLTQNQATGGDTLGDTTGFTAVNGGTLTRDTTEKWAGTGSIKYVSANAVAGEGVRTGTNDVPVVAGKVYVGSVYLKGSGTVFIRLSNQVGAINADSPTITLTSNFVRYSVYAAAVSGDTSFLFSIRTATQQSATFYIDGLQLEEGTTASDWALPVVDYSNAVLNPSAFTVEFDFDITMTKAAPNPNINWLFTVGSRATQAAEVYFNNGYLSYNTALSSVNNAVQVNATAYSGIVRVGAVYVNATKQYLWVNGIKVASSSTPKALTAFLTDIHIGSSTAKTHQCNSYISNLRISKIARTDTEMAYTGKLVADEYTTYYSDMKESISTRPYCKDSQGNAVPMLTAESPVMFSNAIINGDFRLASRGTSFTNPAAYTYTLDGMLIAHNGTGETRVVTQESFILGQTEVPGAEKFLRLYQSVAPSGQTFGMFQIKLNGFKQYSGKQCLVSMFLRSPEKVILHGMKYYQYMGTGGSPSADVSGFFAQNIQVKSNFSKFSFLASIPPIAGKTLGTNNDYCLNVFMYLPINAAFTLDIADIELKPIEAPAAFERRPLQIEQQLMSRFLQKLPANLQLRATNVSANTIDFEYRLPVTMRANPAISGTYAETTNWKVNSLAGSQTTGFALALLNAAPDRVGLRLTKTAHGLTDATLSLVTDILLSAEL